MRQYRTDSAHAASRVIALALLADGGLDRSELNSLARSQVLDALGIAPDCLERVIREFYEDVMTSMPYHDATHCRLPDPVVDALLDEVADPDCQDHLLKAMFEIVGADGKLTEEETRLLARATERWGRPGRWPVRVRHTAMSA